jgi:hypothetical protein
MASWSGFWNGFGSVFAKIGVWAVDNPQIILTIVAQSEAAKASTPPSK